MEQEKEVKYVIVSKQGTMVNDKSGNMVKYKTGDELMLKPSLAKRLNDENKNLELQLVETSSKPSKEKEKV